MSPYLYRLVVVLHGSESKDDKQKSQSVYWKTLSTRASSALETWQKREVTSKWITKIDRQLIGDAICLFVCLFVCLLLLFFFFFFFKFFLNNDIVDSSIFWLPIYNILEHQHWGGGGCKNPPVAILATRPLLSCSIQGCKLKKIFI